MGRVRTGEEWGDEISPPPLSSRRFYFLRRRGKKNKDKVAYLPPRQSPPHKVQSRTACCKRKSGREKGGKCLEKRLWSRHNSRIREQQVGGNLMLLLRERLSLKAAS